MRTFNLRSMTRLLVLTACAVVGTLGVNAGTLVGTFPDSPDGSVRPRQGKPYRIAIQVKAEDGTLTPAAGAKVTATYRPNAHKAVTRTWDVGQTDSSGHLAWSPRDAGVAKITATLGEDSWSQQISVLFDPYPKSGIIIMLLAGCTLMGTIILSFIRLLT